MLRLCALFCLTAILSACISGSDDRYLMPAEGRVVTDADNGSIAIKTDGRTRVRATRTGRVLFAGKTAEGRTVVLDHGGGMRSRYTHLQRISVARGEWIRSGKPVGWVGKRRDTSAELGFALSLAQATIDPARIIEVPKMAMPPNVVVSIEDQRDELDTLVQTVAAGTDKYGPKPSGAGLVLETKASKTQPAEGGYAPGYDKYGALPKGDELAP